ncbi:MAG: L-threonylcarbamoyladenylate synthase [Candidatus Latescibacteria bacterium]|nr:L-threonylcarbamoyladenylate synthase [Candidatus Latescibacterota bacterium]
MTTEQLGTSDTDLERAALIVRAGGVVAYPTETYYGLGALAMSQDAVAAVAQAKGQPDGKPIALIIGQAGDLDILTPEITPAMKALAENFWPGPLTLVVPAIPDVSPAITGGTGTVGVRVSSHPIAGKLARLIEGPLTATSANLHDMVPASTALVVAEQLDGAISAIVDGGQTAGGPPSTVVAIECGVARTIRSGAVPKKEIDSILRSQSV